MLDHRRVLFFVIAGVIAVIVIVAAVAVVLSQQPHKSAADPTQTPPTASASTPSTQEDASETEDPLNTPTVETPTESTPSAEADEASTATATYETTYEQMAWKTALEASSWNGPRNPQQRTTRYEEVGMSAELAETYEPVWAEIFGDNITAEVATRPSTRPQLHEIQGTEGAYIWRVAVEVTFEGTWHSTTSGTTQRLSPRKETWWITIDQAQNAVVAIDQPSAESLKIRVNEED